MIWRRHRSRSSASSPWTRSPRRRSRDWWRSTCRTRRRTRRAPEWTPSSQSTRISRKCWCWRPRSTRKRISRRKSKRCSTRRWPPTPQTRPPMPCWPSCTCRKNAWSRPRSNSAEIVKLEPRSVPALTMMGLLCYVSGELDEAQQSWEKALQIDNYAAAAANDLAWLYAEGRGSLEVALLLAQTAKSKYPNLPEVNDTLGWVYYRKDLVVQAIVFLQQSLDMEPHNPVYHYHLGMAYARKGDDAKARRLLEASAEDRSQVLPTPPQRRRRSSLSFTSCRKKEFMTTAQKNWTAAALIAAGFVALYWDVVAKPGDGVVHRRQLFARLPDRAGRAVPRLGAPGPSSRRPRSGRARSGSSSSPAACSCWRPACSAPSCS